jgi:hypothetical protein
LNSQPLGPVASTLTSTPPRRRKVMFKNKNTLILWKTHLVTNKFLTRLRVYRMESRSRQHLWRVGGKQLYQHKESKLPLA